MSAPLGIYFGNDIFKIGDMVRINRTFTGRLILLERNLVVLDIDYKQIRFGRLDVSHIEMA